MWRKFWWCWSWWTINIGQHSNKFTKNTKIQTWNRGRWHTRKLVGQVARLRPQSLWCHHDGIGCCLRWVYIQGFTRHERTEKSNGIQQEQNDLPKIEGSSAKNKGHKTARNIIWDEDRFVHTIWPDILIVVICKSMCFELIVHDLSYQHFPERLHLKRPIVICDMSAQFLLCWYPRWREYACVVELMLWILKI